MRRLTSILFLAVAIVLLAGRATTAQVKWSPEDKKTVEDFQKRARRYIDRREWLRGQQSKLPTDATPEQIEAAQSALRSAVMADRVNSRQGDVFTLQASALIRDLIRKEFVGWERSELRKQVLEADTRGVKLQANVPYPESKELVHMPPTLLLALPEIPKELRYRFIGRSLAILDRDSSLIVDFMPDALP